MRLLLLKTPELTVRVAFDANLMSNINVCRGDIANPRVERGNESVCSFLSHTQLESQS